MNDRAARTSRTSNRYMKKYQFSIMVTWKLLRVILLLSVLGLRRVTCQSTLATVDNELSECPSTEKDLINLVLDTRKANNHLRQMVENLEMRLEIASTGVTQLLQQMVVQSSASNASSVEMRLETVEMRLDNLGTGVEQLLQHASHCPCNCDRSSNHYDYYSFEEPLDVTTAVTGRVTQPTPQSSTNDMLSTPVAIPGTPTIAYEQPGSYDVKSIATYNDQLFVSRFSIRYIAVFNATSFQLLRNMSIPGFGEQVNGLAPCASSNVLYVSDYNNNCVHRVDLSNVSNVMKWNVAMGPAGISINSVRNILVTFFMETKLQEYTPSGSLVREILASNSMYLAVELNNGLLAVTRQGPVHGIARMSMDGHVIHSYGNEAGSGVGQMKYPRYFAVDKQGYFIVADQENNRILIVNPTMTDARQLPLPLNTNLHRPLSLCLDESRGRLYVGEDTGHHRMFVFENVTNVGALFNN